MDYLTQLSELGIRESIIQLCLVHSIMVDPTTSTDDKPHNENYSYERGCGSGVPFCNNDQQPLETSDWPTYTAFLAIVTEELNLLAHKNIQQYHNWLNVIEDSSGIHSFIDFTILIENNRRVNAHIQTKCPSITFDVGLSLALMDLFASLLASGDFLSPVEEIPQSIDLDYFSRAFLYDYDGRYRYYDFSDGDIHPMTKVLRVMPGHPVRICQLQLLHDLAFTFIHYHEMAHWWLGHCKLVDKEVIPEGEYHGNLAFATVAESPANSSFSNEVYEYQADLLSLMMTFTLLGFNHSKNDTFFELYHSQLLALGLREGPWIKASSITEKLRFLMSAAGSLVLLLERTRRNTNKQPQGHPSPDIRLVTVFVIGTRLALEIAKQGANDVDPDIVESDVLSAFFEAFALVTGDLNLANDVLQTESDLFYRSDVGNEEATDLELDIVALAFDPLLNASELRTKACKKYVKIERESAKLERLIAK